MGKIIWAQPGLDDLEELMDFLGKDSPAYAERIGTRIVEAPRVLEEWPQSGSIVPEFGVQHIRELIVRPYRVIYTVRGKDCYVVAVIHGSRDLSRIHDQDDFEQVGSPPG